MLKEKANQTVLTYIFNSYLHETEMSVCISGCETQLSSWTHVDSLNSTRNSHWTIIISLTHKWPQGTVIGPLLFPKISFIKSMTICRWLHDVQYVQRNPISPRPNQFPKRFRWTTNMGWQMGHEGQCLKMSNHENPQIYKTTNWKILYIKPADFSTSR